MAFDGNKRWGGKYDELIAKTIENFDTMMHDTGTSLNSESEIEEMLSFVFCAYQHVPFYSDTQFNYQAMSWCFPQVWTLAEAEGRVWLPGTVYVFSQVEIADYRVDFLAIMKFAPHGREPTTFYLAIECDGHDFHEKTKEQARRDKSRDRALLLSGIPCMRFAGSEIWKDAYACGKQVDDFFSESAQRLFAIHEPQRAAEIAAMVKGEGE